MRRYRILSICFVLFVFVGMMGCGRTPLLDIKLQALDVNLKDVKYLDLAFFTKAKVDCTKVNFKNFRDPSGEINDARISHKSHGGSIIHLSLLEGEHYKNDGSGERWESYVDYLADDNITIPAEGLPVTLFIAALSAASGTKTFVAQGCSDQIVLKKGTTVDASITLGDLPK